MAIAGNQRRIAIFKTGQYGAATLNEFAPAYRRTRYLAADLVRKARPKGRHLRDPHAKKIRQRAGRKIGRDSEVPGLGPAARAVEHVALGLCQCLRRQIRDMRQAGRQHQRIAGHIVAGCHEVDVKPQPPHGLVPAEDQFEIAEVLALRLDAGDPGGFIVIDDGNRRRPGLRQRDGLEFGAGLRRLSSAL